MVALRAGVTRETSSPGADFTLFVTFVIFICYYAIHLLIYYHVYTYFLTDWPYLKSP